MIFVVGAEGVLRLPSDGVAAHELEFRGGTGHEQFVIEELPQLLCGDASSGDEDGEAAGGGVMPREAVHTDLARTAVLAAAHEGGDDGACDGGGGRVQAAPGQHGARGRGDGSKGAYIVRHLHWVDEKKKHTFPDIEGKSKREKKLMESVRSEEVVQDYSVCTDLRQTRRGRLVPVSVALQRNGGAYNGVLDRNVACHFNQSYCAGAGRVDPMDVYKSRLDAQRRSFRSTEESIQRANACINARTELTCRKLQASLS